MSTKKLQVVIRFTTGNMSAHVFRYRQGTLANTALKFAYAYNVVLALRRMKIPLACFLVLSAALENGKAMAKHAR